MIANNLRNLSLSNVGLSLYNSCVATRIPKDVLKWFQRTGAEGGRARAVKHSKEQLSAWAKLGGRPKKDNGTKPNGGK